MKILGISAFYHDSAASLIQDGCIVAACQEERLTRIKHDAAFPAKAIQFCLRQANCKPEGVDAIVFFEKPFLKFERLLETYLAFAPKGFSSFRKAIPLWLNEKLFQKKLLQEELIELGFSKKQCRGVLFSEHHLSHAASAYYASPFDEALVLTMDGVGEWDTTTVYLGRKNSLEKIKEIHFPHSLGLLYSAFTYYCGFKVNSGEYKLMGLAPYGTPKFAEKIKTHLIDIKEDGSFKLDLSYFDYCTGLTMTNKKFDTLFENSFRTSESELKQVHMDLAASIQYVLEEVVLKICHSLSTEFKVENLCLAGGVALNCVANGKIYEQNLFKKIWVQPAAGDAGGSLGSALAAYFLHFKNERTTPTPDLMQGSYLGPSYSDEEILKSLEKLGAKFSMFASQNDLIDHVAKLLENQDAIGWLQGRSEFGPRALGNRSIIADPRSEKIQKTLNLKVKFRESFRPFAPAVLEEDTSYWFDFKTTSPYMLMVAEVKQQHRIQLNPEQKKLFGIDLLNIAKSAIPAVTHVDYSARLQTVSKNTNPLFHKLISKFKENTGCGVLVNTSFNIRGEPIVCSIEDAFRCFMGTQLDALVVGPYVLKKQDQPKELIQNYTDQFELD